MEEPRHGAVHQASALVPDLLVHDAVEYEDEESLERVEDSEGVGDEDGWEGDGQDAHRPGGPQEEEEAKQPLDVELQ